VIEIWYTLKNLDPTTHGIIARKIVAKTIIAKNVIIIARTPTNAISFCCY
jgi:hypothetical protein